MSEAIRAKITLTDYLQGEQTSTSKHELIDGEVYAMTGASESHNIITLNLAADLKAKLKGSPCKPFVSDMKLHAGGDVYYPDVMVICDKHEQDTEYLKHAPVLVVEVLSKSTRAFDHSTKQLKYLQLPSLQYYVLIEQDFCEVSVLSRDAGFVPKYYYLGQHIEFERLNLTVSVDDIYEDIDNEDTRGYLKSNT